MRSEELAREVEGLEARRAELAAQLDGLVMELQKVISALAGNWTRGEVSRRIGDHAEVVAAMDDARLKELKRRVQELTLAYPEMFRKRLENRANWPHCRPANPDPNGTKEYYGKFFEEVFRAVISSLGTVLEEFGLIGDVKGQMRSWEKGSTGRWRFISDSEFGMKRHEIYRNYIRLCEQYQSLSAELATKQEEQVRAQARERWDAI